MKITNEFLGQEMTRAQFIGLGVKAFLLVFGVSNFVSLLQSQQKQQGNPANAVEHSRSGFGSSKFGV